MTDEQPVSIHDKLNSETARISWPELERHFAAGRVIYVAPGLDLITAGQAMTQDNAEQVKAWMQSGDLGLLADDVASQWAQDDAGLWALVVKPWVLVQQRSQ